MSHRLAGSSCQPAGALLTLWWQRGFLLSCNDLLSFKEFLKEAEVNDYDRSVPWSLRVRWKQDTGNNGGKRWKEDEMF